MSYEINQIFTGEYPPEAAAFCNESGSFYISEIEADSDGNRQFQIVAVPEPTFEEKVTAKKTEIANARYNYEIQGIAVNGVAVKTDRESQSLITGAALRATQDSTYTVVWKTADGFVTLDAATVIAVAKAVSAHVEAAFAQEAELVAQIDACTTEGELSAITWTDPK